MSIKIEHLLTWIKHVDVSKIKTYTNEYMSHKFEVAQEISIDDFKIGVIYKNCLDYKNGDINALDDETFCITSHDTLAELIEDTHEDDFFDAHDEHVIERMNDLLENVQQIIPTIKNMDDLHALYLFLNDWRPTLTGVLHEPHTPDVEDYQQDEHGNWFRAVGPDDFLEYCDDVFVGERKFEDSL